MMKNIFIYPNLRKDSARDILQPVCDQLRRDGVRLMLPKQMRVVPPIIEDADYMKTEDAVQFADMAVVLGGDGTMLRLAREAAQNQLPLLGINVGHVGFMTELEPAELPEMEKLFTGEFSLDSRMMLHVAVQRGGRIVYENDALNDIVIAKGTAFRVVRVGISADNEEVTRFNGDGVIPICAHALAAKSFVFAPERSVSITAACEGGSEVFISADGGQGFAVRPDDRVIITRSDLQTRLIRLKGNSFYRILQQKL